VGGGCCRRLARGGLDRVGKRGVGFPRHEPHVGAFAARACESLGASEGRAGGASEDIAGGRGEGPKDARGRRRAGAGSGAPRQQREPLRADAGRVGSSLQPTLVGRGTWGPHGRFASSSGSGNGRNAASGAYRSSPQSVSPPYHGADADALLARHPVPATGHRHYWSESRIGEDDVPGGGATLAAGREPDVGLGPELGAGPSE